MPETLQDREQRQPPRMGGAGGRPSVKERVIQTDRKARLASRFFRYGLLVGIVLLLGLSSFMQGRLNVARDQLGLTRVAPLQNAPPMLAFTTVALGGFRGLIANMLWLRVNDLQEEDKYFEMVQLADWITKLQPHFVTVWVHLAWNMSYNISIKFTDPRDRWMWVRRGIELIRDEGLKYNPNEPILYRELAWHFQHKMGADLDDAHHYYKAVWVHDMDRVFGRGRPNFERLIHPQTPEEQGAADLLRDKFKMNPQWMKETDERYGPLEWHLPESHAIYWAYVALNKTEQRRLKKEDLITCRRVIFQSLQLAFRRGRLVYPNKNSDSFTYAPKVDIVDQANKAYLEMMDQEPVMRDNIANGHKNFIRWAVYYLYVYGQIDQAKKWFGYLREKYPAAIPPDQDLESYALMRAQETVGETSHDDAKAVIVGFVREAYWSLALGEEEKAVNYLRFAQVFRSRFQEAVGPKSVERVGLPELNEIKKAVQDEMLDPQNGLEPTLAAQLRTALNLPAPSAQTNAPAVTAPPPGGSPAPATNAPPAGDRSGK